MLNGMQKAGVPGPRNRYAEQSKKGTRASPIDAVITDREMRSQGSLREEYGTLHKSYQELLTLVKEILNMET